MKIINIIAVFIFSAALITAAVTFNFELMTAPHQILCKLKSKQTRKWLVIKHYEGIPHNCNITKNDRSMRTAGVNAVVIFRVK